MKTIASLVLGVALSSSIFAAVTHPTQSDNAIIKTHGKAMSHSITTTQSSNQFEKKYLPIKTWKTPNGTDVYFVKSTEVPIVDLDIIFHAGSTYDGKQYGLSSMTSEMLMSGVKGISENELLDQIDATGAKIHTFSDRDMSGISLRSMSNQTYLNPAVALTAKIISTPSFPENAFKRLQKQTLMSLELDKQSASSQAYKNFFNTLFGESSYAHPSIGTKTTIENMTQKDIIDFYHKYYVAKNAIITIVGDLTEDEARDISQRIAQGLAQGEAASSIAMPSKDLKSNTVHIPFQSQQTTVLIGTYGVKKGDPLFFPLLVGNQILGGSGLNSLLFNEVRKERGLAYGANSGFSTYANAGTFVMSTKTRAEKTNETIKVMNETLESFIKNGPTPKQLEAAKKYLVGSFPLSFSNNIGKLDILNLIAFYHLPENYLDTYTKNVEAVTAKDIQHAFNEVINQKKLLTVTVGDVPLQEKANDLEDLAITDIKSPSSTETDKSIEQPQ